jgi:hypothetical protein
LKTLHNFTAQIVPFDIFEENILRITDLCSFKIFAERLNPQWDADTPFPVPAPYIPPESIKTETEQNGTTDIGQNGKDTSTQDSDADQNGSEPASIDFMEGRFSPDLIRGANKPEETDSAHSFDLLDSPDQEFSGFSDPRFPEPKPSIVFSKPESSGSSKPDLVRFSEPALPETQKQPDQPVEDSSKPDASESFQKVPEKSELKQEIQSSTMETTKSFPIFEALIFLLILIAIVATLYTVWTNLHIFMPVLILVFALLKFWGKA